MKMNISNFVENVQIFANQNDLQQKRYHLRIIYLIWVDILKEARSCL